MRGGRRFADKNMRQQMNRKRIPISQERNTLQCATPAGSSGDNGSVFFSRVHPAAECAMAEILVSDLCECRPPLLIGGAFCFPVGDGDFLLYPLSSSSSPSTSHTSF